MSNATPNTPALDLDAIEQEIINVESALERLSAGTYFVDEITGSALADDVLAADPTARHA
jgi:RNA polymerase-binding transcription factor DksA